MLVNNENNSHNHIAATLKNSIIATAGALGWELFYEGAKLFLGPKISEEFVLEIVANVIAAPGNAVGAITAQGLLDLTHLKWPHTPPPSWKDYLKDSTISIINGGLWSIWYWGWKNAMEFLYSPIENAIAKEALTNLSTLLLIGCCSFYATSWLKEKLQHFKPSTITNAVADTAFAGVSILESSFTDKKDRRPFRAIASIVGTSTLITEAVQHSYSFFKKKNTRNASTETDSLVENADATASYSTTPFSKLLV